MQNLVTKQVPTEPPTILIWTVSTNVDVEATVHGVVLGTPLRERIRHVTLFYFLDGQKVILKDVI